MVADSRPRFSYGSTEVYHFKGTSAFSDRASVAVQVSVSWPVVDTRNKDENSQPTESD